MERLCMMLFYLCIFVSAETTTTTDKPAATEGGKDRYKGKSINVFCLHEG